MHNVLFCKDEDYEAAEMRGNSSLTSRALNKESGDKNIAKMQNIY